MSAYTIALVKKEVIAHETMAFHFQKPEGFEYRAGQNCDFTLIDPPESDAEGNKRTFSLVSSPDESELVIATRLRDSAFKRVLRNYEIGAEIQMDGPYGDFTLHKTSATPAVFLIGGIGITPVRSIIAYATQHGLPHTITLLYSNKTPQDAVFLNDFEMYAKQNPHFTFVPVMTRASAEMWQGESGYIDNEKLKKFVTDLTVPIYYLSGPAGMVIAMRQLLIQAGANEDNIRTEEFPGY